MQFSDWAWFVVTLSITKQGAGFRQPLKKYFYSYILHCVRSCFVSKIIPYIQTDVNSHGTKLEKLLTKADSRCHSEPGDSFFVQYPFASGSVHADFEKVSFRTLLTDPAFFAIRKTETKKESGICTLTPSCG